MKIAEMMQVEKENEANKKSFKDKVNSIFSVGEEGVNRVRFLSDFDGGWGIMWHKKFGVAEGPCWSQYDGRECPHCAAEDKILRRQRSMYAFALYDYEAQKSLILFGSSYNKTLVGQLFEYYDTKKSILNRDFYMKRRVGDEKDKQHTTSYSLVAEDPSTFEFSSDYPIARTPQAIERLQKCLEQTLIRVYDESLADELGITDEDKIENFYQKEAKPVQKRITRRPVAEAPKPEEQDDVIEFEDN